MVSRFLRIAPFWMVFGLVFIACDRPGTEAFAQFPNPDVPDANGSQPVASQPPESQTDVFQPGLIIASVGNQHILRGDLMGEVNMVLGPILAKIPPAELARQAEQIEQQKDGLLRRFLEAAIMRKLMYADFLRTFEKKAPPDKRKEIFPKMQKSVNEHFAKQLEVMRTKVETATPEDLGKLFEQNIQLARLAIMMKENNLQRESELDQLLRQYGSSMQYQRQIFLESALGSESRSKSIDRNPVITHDEMLAYYNENASEFRVLARARWEQLTARFDQFPDKFNAGEHIKRMGDEAYFGGSFIPVAKKLSQEPNSEDGGQHDWIFRGSLKSKSLDNNIFTLPIGEMSPIIEDDQGLHIIRVLEREDERVIPFAAPDTQEKIREKIRRQKMEKQSREYTDELRKSIPVWTIFDDESAPMTPAAGS